GELVGTVALKPNANDPGIVELQKMYVARSMRRNGLGTFLCSLVEREARDRGVRAIELWSDVKLLDAHRAVLLPHGAGRGRRRRYRPGDRRDDPAHAGRLVGGQGNHDRTYPAMIRGLSGARLA